MAEPIRHALVTRTRCKVCGRVVDLITWPGSAGIFEPSDRRGDERAPHACGEDEILRWQTEATFRRVRRHIRANYARHQITPTGSAGGLYGNRPHEEPGPKDQ